ncbi:MAG TPA: ATP-binding protein [Steroidobacteraceae bacterium]|nr:ATP-binding protein [Steroidobacteraceae bacterium]
MQNFHPIAQLLLQFSPDALIVVDCRGQIQFANETTRELFGYTEAQLLGKPMDFLVPPRFRVRHAGHVSSYMRSPSNREMGARLSDLFALRADGSEFPAGIRLAPFKSGDETFIAASIRDMTERRVISDALIAAREEADRANRAKSRFLATASHDLRQPLQTVRMINASLLKLTEAHPQIHELLLRQETAIDGASRLLNALLDISRLESGAVEPLLSPVPLAGAYAELRQEFEPAAHAKNLHMAFPESGNVILTDKILFMQMLQNLIGNALKYTERGHVRVVETIEGDALMLSIEDSGVGIPEGKLDRIFDEYYQVGHQGTQRLGVGLGLAIVREVARILGYSVSVFSSLGKGTQVRVRIPAQTLVTDAPRGELPREHAPPSAPQAGCRIVLLEDNDSVRKATELFLSLEGYEIRSAASVAGAKAFLAEMTGADILIADYHLEGNVTGLDVLQELRAEKRRDVPAVLLSGDLQSMMRALKTPIANARFLSKPVDTKALLLAITELAAS